MAGLLELEKPRSRYQGDIRVARRSACRYLIAAWTTPDGVDDLAVRKWYQFETVYWYLLANHRSFGLLSEPYFITALEDDPNITTRESSGFLEVQRVRKTPCGLTMEQIVREFSIPVLPWKYEDRQVWAARRIQQDVIHGRPLRIDADGLKALRAGRLGLLPPGSRRPQSYTVLWMERLSRQIERFEEPFTRTELLGDHDTNGVNKEAFRLLLRHHFVKKLARSKGAPRYRLVKKYRAVPAYSRGRGQKDWWKVIDPTLENATYHTPPVKSIGDRTEAAERMRAEPNENLEVLVKAAEHLRAKRGRSS
jgi:hypothetical protein